MAHITGGGIFENVPRMLPASLGVRIDVSKIPVPRVFSLIGSTGEIPLREMYGTFNMGIGFVLALPQGDVERALGILEPFGYGACVIGEVVKARESEKERVYTDL